MDFPKSVAGVGLVGGRFIDENPVTGQQGSLLASVWGNQITDEILNVLGEAYKIAGDDDKESFKPTEERSNQLLESIKVLIKDSIPETLSDWKDVENKPVAVNALTNIITINTTATLTNEQLGLILIDASASDVALTLPQANATNKAVKVTLYRLDNSTNKVIIKSATGETIYFYNKLNANGYGFFYLMGAGDYCQVMSNGSKGWYKLNRLDDTPLGRICFDSSIEAAPGGYLVANGTLLSRTEYPWLWDFAQKSGSLTSESGMASYGGCFTSGDGSTTFRLPDLRGEFMRALDLGRNVDIDRKVGSTQTDLLKKHSHKTIDRNYSLFGNTAGGGFAISWVSGAGDPGNTSVTGGDETRPRNVAYPAYIKII